LLAARLLAAVVDFGLAAFLESKRTAALVVHAHVAGDIRVGWDNHLEFARENPNLYKLMWAPGASVNGAAGGEAFRILYERPELGASKGQLRVSVETAARMILPAVTGAALAAIYRPELFSDPTYATQLREAVIAAVTAPADKPTGKRASGDAGAPTIATAAETLKTQLAVEHSAHRTGAGADGSVAHNPGRRTHGRTRDADRNTQPRSTRHGHDRGRTDNLPLVVHRRRRPLRGRRPRNGRGDHHRPERRD
jgi:hypothetical protein